MSLLDIAMKIKESGFDPKKDRAGGGGQLPAGTYEVVIETIEHNISATSGWECVRIITSVLEGEYVGRKEYVNISILEEWNGKKTHEFILERNIKLIQKVAEFGDVKLMQSDFEDTSTIARALQPAMGKIMKLEIQETPNKNKPDQPYRNHDFFESQLKPDFSVTPELNEDDLPF